MPTFQQHCPATRLLVSRHFHAPIDPLFVLIYPLRYRQLVVNDDSRRKIGFVSRHVCLTVGKGWMTNYNHLSYSRNSIVLFALLFAFWQRITIVQKYTSCKYISRFAHWSRWTVITFITNFVQFWCRKHKTVNSSTLHSNLMIFNNKMFLIHHTMYGEWGTAFVTHKTQLPSIKCPSSAILCTVNSSTLHIRS